jgi:opacity protein-like surface antigen
MTNNLRTRLLAAAAVLSIATSLAQAHDGVSSETTAAIGVNPLADAVRSANDRFKDVAAATAEGYAPIPCASAATGNGAMGIHYVNANYLKDDAVDVAKPEAVMYEPKADGTLELIAVEYITSKGPASLGGQLFSFNSAPNRYGLGPFYELHVWAWKANPTGTFADNNPDVSCEAAKAE